MSWVPRDLASLCHQDDRFSTCATAYIMFLTLVTKIFSSSRDEKPRTSHPQQFTAPFQESFFPSGNFFSAHIKPEEFDFIVVGAGSAGCVVANRLSEVKKWKILLLEAGIEEPKVAEVPAFAPMLQRSNIDWGYSTQPQKHGCLSRPGGQCAWARGKVMGGSSTINYMMYVRGSPQDYDLWESMGNEGWSYEDVLPFFKKSEHNTDHDVDRHFHGDKGYQWVGRFPYTDQNIGVILDAWKELGVKTTDVNTPRQLGAMHLQMTQHKGRRVSTNSAFIRSIRWKRKNLTVRTQAHVLRVLIDSQKKAFGVEYLEQNKIRTVLARKEVILSAGAINSPKILLLSGVGPDEYLKHFGIKLISDLKVGHNLQDHVTVDGVIISLHPNVTATSAQPKELIDEVQRHAHNEKTSLGSTGPLSAGVFIQSTYQFTQGLPDLQYAFDPVNIKDFLTDPSRAAEYNVGPLSHYDGITIRPILLNPRSRGFVGLNKSDPVLGSPEIYANYFTIQPDLDIMIEGIETGLKLINTNAMKKIHASLVQKPLPGCKSHVFSSTNYWACLLTHYTSTIFHPVGTCKMGTDPDAVVDPHLKVYGVNNLRVIDASIMPKIVSGNTNAPVIMIGEKGSYFIKKHWGVS